MEDVLSACAGGLVALDVQMSRYFTNDSGGNAALVQWTAGPPGSESTLAKLHIAPGRAAQQTPLPDVDNSIDADAEYEVEIAVWNMNSNLGPSSVLSCSPLLQPVTVEIDGEVREMEEGESMEGISIAVLTGAGASPAPPSREPAGPFQNLIPVACEHYLRITTKPISGSQVHHLRLPVLGLRTGDGVAELDFTLDAVVQHTWKSGPQQVVFDRGDEHPLVVLWLVASKQISPLGMLKHHVEDLDRRMAEAKAEGQEQAEREVQQYLTQLLQHLRATMSSCPSLRVTALHKTEDVDWVAPVDGLGRTQEQPILTLVVECEGRAERGSAIEVVLLDTIELLHPHLTSGLAPGAKSSVLRVSTRPGTWKWAPALAGRALGFVDPKQAMEKLSLLCEQAPVQIQLDRLVAMLTFDDHPGLAAPDKLALHVGFGTRHAIEHGIKVIQGVE